MGTRGLVCFRYKGKLYRVYVQYDAYPEGVGQSLLDELHQAVETGTLDSWKEKLENVVLLNNDADPDPEVVEALRPYWANALLVKPHACDATNYHRYYWYTHKSRGSFLRVLESGYLLESDSDDVAYSYILDFDKSLFVCIVGDTSREGDNYTLRYRLDRLPRTISFEADV